MMKYLRSTLIAFALIISSSPVWADTGAFLEITLKIQDSDRSSAGAIYAEYKKPFLNTIAGAKSKQLLIRKDDVQVLHGFDSVESAQKYLSSELFNKDVVVGLKPYMKAEPEIRIYQVY